MAFLGRCLVALPRDLLPCPARPSRLEAKHGDDDDDGDDDKNCDDGKNDDGNDDDDDDNDDDDDCDDDDDVKSIC